VASENETNYTMNQSGGEENMISLRGHADVYLLDNPYNVADAQAG
jgi:hypothetical protein